MNLTNTQFVFESKTKRVLIGGMALGVLCLILTALNDDEYHTRFWTNYLHNSVYFTGIAFMSMFFLSAQITAFAGWNSLMKRVWEAMSQFMWVGIILMSVLVIGVWGHFHHLYHWNTPGITDPANPIYDKIIAGKAGFLNAKWYTLGTVGFLSIWFYWAFNLRKASVDQDTMETEGFTYYKKQRKWAASFLPIGGFLSTVFLWQAVMSIDPHWYSTMFAWYSMISMWLGGLAMTVMVIIYLKSLGYLEYVTREHLHDIGQYLFGISVFWTYLWFDQYMLIWYANNGEETIYFRERINHYPVLFWGNLLLNFVTPFLILMRNDTKRKFGTMFFVALIVFFGHWWDYFYMIKPGARIAAHEAKEISEGTFGRHHKAAPMPEAAPATTEQMSTTEQMPATEPSEAATQEAEAPATTAASEAAPTAAADEAGAAHGEQHGEDPKGFKLGYTLPGFYELGTMIGFLSLFLFFFFNQLSKSSLVAWKDPYLEESMHHSTGTLIGAEASDEHGHDEHH